MTAAPRPAVLVLGGAGYIGSHVCKALARAGFMPVTYDNLSRGFANAVRWGPLEIGDIRDETRLGDALRTHAPIAAMHFAGMAYVGESVVDPLLYYDCNIAGVCAMTRALLRHGVEQLVFSSTCAVYGAQDSKPISEATPQAPINPYGFTKLAAERMLADAGRAHGLRSISLRYFNAAGADPDGEIGEQHDPETHAIPLAIEAALGLRATFSIFGDDFPTPDGTAVRDYVHVSDLADAHVLALRHLLQGGPSTAVNLGAERGVSVLEICAAIARVLGRAPLIDRQPRREGDPACLVADASRARMLLNWAPTRSDIDRIVSDAATWAKRRTPVALSA
ncbi:MAG: UDP-glucose 4-epimerase GalE [Alphaproteobacteria bacterium]|nr:UDP-glucose 4-epimerase GalE [Alphaproteobacteria bacterium]